MSVVIVGGNECMARRYVEICREYRCKAKVFPKSPAALKSIGTPDLLVLFTGTVSHKMVRSTLRETRGKAVKIVRCHTSSASALRNILQTHT